MTMVPEAWQNDKTMSEEKRDYYKWSSCVMEPWDGPGILTVRGRFGRLLVYLEAGVHLLVDCPFSVLTTFGNLVQHFANCHAKLSNP